MSSRSRNKHKKKKRLIVFIVILAILAVIGHFSYPILCKYYNKFFGEKEEKVLGPITTMQEYRSKYPQYNLFGIDISEYQETINWDTLTAANTLDFVFVRATAGNNRVDEQFTHNWNTLKEKNILRGAYHYYRPNENSTEQAENFIKTANLQKGDIAPILDIEKYSNVQSATRLKTGLLNWLDIVEKKYATTPIIYTYSDFYFRVLKDDPRFGRFPIWIAHYSESEKKDKLPEKWAFWQFCEDGRLAGINANVDVNVCSSLYEIQKVIIK